MTRNERRDRFGDVWPVELLEEFHLSAARRWPQCLPFIKRVEPAAVDGRQSDGFDRCLADSRGNTSSFSAWTK